MTSKNLDSFTKILDDFIAQKMAGLKGLDIYEVTGVNVDTFTVNIKHPNFKKYVFNDVQIASLGLGNFKGVMKIPSEEDMVIVGFIGKQGNQPIILGTVFDQTSQAPQANPIVQVDELLLNAKQKGSYIVIKPDGNIIIRTTDENGAKKGSITVTTDGKIILNGGVSPIARVGDKVNTLGSTEPAGTGPHTHDINFESFIITGSGNTTN